MLTKVIAFKNLVELSVAINNDQSIINVLTVDNGNALVSYYSAPGESAVTANEGGKITEAKNAK